MPHSCCAVGCTNRSGKESTLSFYKIPNKRTPFEENRRTKWIQAIKRADWDKPEWTFDRISRQTICSDHFVSGKRSEVLDDVDFVPSIFKHTSSPRHGVKRKLAQKREAMYTARCKNQTASRTVAVTNEDTVIEDTVLANDFEVNDVGCQTDPTKEDELLRKYQSELLSRNEEVYRLRAENAMLTKKSKVFGFDIIKDNDNSIHFYTGLLNLSLFMWVVAIVRDKVKVCHARLSVEDHVLLVFMKLRLGLLQEDLAHRFGLEISIVSHVYRLWLPVLSKYMRALIVWPDRSSIRKHMPVCFRRKYRDCVCIIDCSEIFIERPSNLNARAQTWSNYKHNNTCKYLIGISPAGGVIFLSAGWGGRVSDKRLTIKSGFLHLINYGDCILADRGFLIRDELSEKGAILKIPCFTKGKRQLHVKDVDVSRQLSNVRIHVERVIGRLKKFRLFNSVIPITQIDLIDDAMIVICSAVNLNRSVIAK